MIQMKQAAFSVVAIGAVAAVAGVASAATTTGQPSTSSVPVAVQAAPPETHELALSHGAKIADARVIGSLKDGAKISVVPSEDGKCVLVSGGTAAGDLCAPTSRIENGKAASVLNDCSVSHGRMQITAILPDGATTGRLEFSNGTVGSALPGADGVVWYDGTTPGKGEVFPTGIQALNANGSQTAAVALPVTGSAFCISVPSPLAP